LNGEQQGGAEDERDRIDHRHTGAGSDWMGNGHRQARMDRMTSPRTSVRRWSRPSWRKVSCS
jgi:hypothetical protein